MPGVDQPNRKRGRDGAFSNPNVEPAQQDTLSKVTQVLANYGVTPPQSTNGITAITEVKPIGETDDERQQRRAGIALARAAPALARGQASAANPGGTQPGGGGVQPGVGQGANPGQTRRIPGSSPFNHTKDPSQ